MQWRVELDHAKEVIAYWEAPGFAIHWSCCSGMKPVLCIALQCFASLSTAFSACRRAKTWPLKLAQVLHLPRIASMHLGRDVRDRRSDSGETSSRDATTAGRPAHLVDPVYRQSHRPWRSGRIWCRGSGECCGTRQNGTAEQFYTFLRTPDVLTILCRSARLKRT